MNTTDLNPGTRVRATQLLVANPRKTVLDPVTYSYRDVEGTIMARDNRRVKGWHDTGSPIFERIDPQPTLDGCGYYWVQPFQVGNDKPDPIKVRHDELEVMA